MMPIRGAFRRKAVLISGSLFVLSAPFRFSTCYRPPPMVRFYDYSIPQKDVLPQCQQALEALGYEVETYDLLDFHLITKLRTIRSGLGKARYVVFVKVEDRIAVYVYAESRVFRRGTELGLRAGELTVLEPKRLRLGFQRRVFEPITGALAGKGFRPWSSVDDNERDDREIRAYEEQRLIRHEAELIRQEKSVRLREKETREAYASGRRESRWEAVEEAEQFIAFVDDSLSLRTDTSLVTGWSLVAISRQVVREDDRLRAAFRELLGTYPDYSGSGRIQWIIGPEGRVTNVMWDLETSSGVPDDELSHAIDIHTRTLFFPARESRWGYAVVRREFRFRGHYHNLDVHFARPRLEDILEQYPAVEAETVVDTFFEKSH
ncbi:MAG: hypothetical protein ACE5HZ_01380 [Fidelibacterota bacterium]